MNRIPHAARLVRWYSLHGPLRSRRNWSALWVYRGCTVPDYENLIAIPAT
jgi:hypothetical protein